MKPIPLEPIPGVVKTETSYSQEGRYIDMEKARWHRQRPQKIGGYETWSYQVIAGECRALFPWTDFESNIYVGIGTTTKLYALQLPPETEPVAQDQGWGRGGYGTGGWGQPYTYTPPVTDDLTDITPSRASGTLGSNPITTTAGSRSVNIEHSSHGASAGDTVDLGGAGEVGEITIDGKYVIDAIVDSDNYTITHGYTATFTETGGGGSVTYNYDINIGVTDAQTGTGYGIGAYGVGTYGTPRTGASYLQYPRFWSLDKIGKILLAQHNDGNLYEWDPSSGGRATTVSNAPTDNFAMFVTEERFPVILGAGGTPMKLQWPDGANYTVWTPAATNSANSRTLTDGSRLLAGSAFGNLYSLVWSDTALYTMLYRGGNLVYQTRRVGQDCGIIGPKAFAIADNRAFWMGPNTFHMYANYVDEIPNVDDIREWVFDNLTDAQKVKCFGGYIPEYREVWFFYPAASSTEPNRFVMVNIDNYWWGHGTWTRTAFALLDIDDNRPLMADTSYIYIHETGVNADGAAMESYVELADLDIGDGERSMFINGFRPNFKDQAGDITIDFASKEQADDTATFDSDSITVSPGDKVVDVRVGGRVMTITITSNEVDGNYRMGKPLLEAKPAGMRRG